MPDSDWESATTLDDYEAAIFEFAADLLSPYTAHIQSLPVLRRPSKEFNDPVWGTVSLGAVEVMVLDSPLLQRLRRIRQLGVAQFVYPGTNHTRIEHSIGVCHQVARLVESALDHANELNYGSEVKPLKKLLPTLRLAGLCHDVGHGLFSHASENALDLNPRVEALAKAFQVKYAKSAKPQLSEMAAFYMVQSPAFSELLAAARHANALAPAPDMPLEAARVIAGLSVNDQMPLLHELISGPFDADKMDYMKRDALMCGIPVVTDIERLVQKIRAVAKPLSQLPRRMRQHVTVGPTNYILLGVARSGARAIDELALGRTLMFDKVYRHQKVRAVEAMVSSVVEQVGPALSARPELLPLHIYDDEFLNLTKDDLQGKADAAGLTLELDAAADIAKRIRLRELFVRSIAFSHRSPFDALADSDERRLYNSRFTSSVRTAVGRKSFLDRLAVEVEKIATLVGRADDIAALPGGRARPYLWIDPPKSDSANQAASENYAHLVTDDRDLIEVSRANADLRGWTDAYSNTRDIGYVFATKSISDIVFVAAELVMRRDHEVRVPDQMKSYSKTDTSRIHTLKTDLAAAGYYPGALRSLGPDPDLFGQGDFEDRLSEVVHKFQGYQGPASLEEMERSEGEPMAFNEESVREWIKQFPAELVPLALKVVEKVHMISRAEVGNAIENYMTTNSLATAVVAPLGDPKDGASIIAYHAGDLEEPLGVRVMPVQGALSADEPLIIVDDFIGLGSSAVSIIEKLMGAEPTTNVNEERVTTLQPESQEALKQREVHFLFVYGYDRGADRLRERAAELGLTAHVHVAHPEDAIPTVRTALDGEPLIDQFVAENSSIGEQLMADEDDDTKRAERVFGYGNEGRLLISSFNTPTVTMTSLWKRGTYDDLEWTALFPRRAKH